MTGPESFGNELYKKHKGELKTLEEVYERLDVADPGTSKEGKEGAQAVYEAMRQKQERLTAAHDAAMTEIRGILDNS